MPKHLKNKPIADFPTYQLEWLRLRIARRRPFNAPKIPN